MQGIEEFIPTEKKVKYLNQLLKVGFDTIDFGSFVSPSVIPQLADTAEVLDRLDISETTSKLLAIIANRRGAVDAVQFEQVHYLGFPFSISETFQLRNTNSTMEGSLKRVAEIQELCVSTGKELVVYISMGFGNPYGDPWNAEEASKWVKKLKDFGIGIFSLADTVGVANPKNITYIFENLFKEFPGLELGAHFHTTPDNWKENVTAAYNAGCRRYDAAIKGLGGCPMADDELVGNMATENLLTFFKDKEKLELDENDFVESMLLAQQIFPV